MCGEECGERERGGGREGGRKGEKGVDGGKEEGIRVGLLQQRLLFTGTCFVALINWYSVPPTRLYDSQWLSPSVHLQCADDQPPLVLLGCHGDLLQMLKQLHQII